jgi:hypothetical protein
MGAGRSGGYADVGGMRRRHGSRTPTALFSLAVAFLAALVFASPAAALEQKLTASDGTGSDQFGESVAIDGDTMVIGAGNAPGAVSFWNGGVAYVYQRTGNVWTQSQKLAPTDGEQDRFGQSVAIDGDTIVVGAFTDDIGGNPNQGSAYVFSRSAGAWSQTAKLTANDGAPDDWFGYDVAIDGDTIVAGSPLDDVGANTDQGSAYTYVFSGGIWIQTARLTGSDGVAGAAFGSSVAIEGDTLVAGASGDQVGANAAQGSAYTFAATNEIWAHSAKLTASDGSANAQLGAAVAIDGDTIVAGARFADADRGAAYTFATTGAAARTQTAKLTASDGAPSDVLGQSVDIDGNTIVAGARGDDVGANTDQGSAYTFARTGAATRTQTAKLVSSDGTEHEWFGYSAAIDGDTIAAGAMFDDVGSNNEQGSVTVFLDADLDGIPDDSDGCPAGAGSGLDTDLDGCKDAGEDSDDDNDSVSDGADSCPTGAASGLDTDGDGCKDAAEDSDDDNDSVTDGSDSCPTGAASGLDTDGDGCKDAGEDSDDDNDLDLDVADNCPTVANADQANTDGDSDGDACDSDDDNDTVLDVTDNCPVHANTTQSDFDSDGQGNACDDDDDNDGTPDVSDAFPRDASETTNSDTDNVGDNADNCDTDDNNNQLNTDGDSEGDACDADDDNDGTNDVDDDFPLDSSEDTDTDSDGLGDNADNCDDVASSDQTDTDGDLEGDVCDIDDDNDTVLDGDDNCQLVDNTDQTNTDDDSDGNACDSDDDADGTPDGDDDFPLDPAEDTDSDADTVGDNADNCVNDANASQTNTDGDPDGDACDTDDDNDGVADGADDCPTTAGTASADGCPVQPDTDPPETTITKKPKDKGTKNKVKYLFVSDEPGSSFECKIDKKPYAPCTSPKKLKLKDGKHKFSVRAIDAAGNVDLTPAKDKFKIVG